MNWFFFIGEDDRTYYTGTLWRIQDGKTEYMSVFESLGIADTIRYDVIAAAVAHQEDRRFFDVIGDFVGIGSEGGVVSKINDKGPDMDNIYWWVPATFMLIFGCLLMMVLCWLMMDSK